MTYTHLLDTNIVSNLIRFPNGIVRKRIEEVGAGSACINLIIAAHARQLGLTLVTANKDEFSRVEGLSVVNWLAI